MSPVTRKAALEYHHLNGVPGKLAIQSTKPLNTQADLSLAYTPGVAYPVLEIEKDPALAYEYTSKGNLVAVISNGTAILGLGDRGALASKPVMEGKCVLFKSFAGVDAIDIEINSRDTEIIIQTIAAIAPTFGGINLEDFRSPECFAIEQRLQALLDIPVFHDDQHGTAIILSAALLNALELTQRRLDEIKVVFSGAGAAAIACARQLVKIGVPQTNIWMCDIRGLVYHGRIEDMFPEKAVFAQGDCPAKLADVLPGAHVFIGLSVANILTEPMLKSMSADPLIFAMANPDPEVDFELARHWRPDAILGSGRSDYPNQINNVLGFPYIFRGALDVRARAINDAMKIAASHALAHLTKEPVPASVLKAYNLTHLEFGREYIVPKALDPRAAIWESSAVAEAAMHTGAARRTLNLDEYRQQLQQKFIKS